MKATDILATCILVLVSKKLVWYFLERRVFNSEPFQTEKTENVTIKYSCSTECLNKHIEKPRKKLPNIKPNMVENLLRSKGLSKLQIFRPKIKKISESKWLEKARILVESYWTSSNVSLKIAKSNANQTQIFNYHYIWYGCNRNFSVLHYLSLLSVKKFKTKSSKVFFHTDCEPEENDYWKEIKNGFSQDLIILKIKPVTSIWGNDLKSPAHQADIYRLLILIKFGGIYIDNDIVLLNPLDDLLEKSISKKIPILGEESNVSLANGFIISVPGATILLRWLVEYKKYKVLEGMKVEPFSVMKIWQLSFWYPDEVEVVKNKMIRPDWSEWHLLWHESIDWMGNYRVVLMKFRILG